MLSLRNWKTKGKLFAAWVALALSFFVLAGCGPRLVKGPAEISKELASPDSIKAKFTLEILDSAEGSHRLSGVLFAVPSKRYRFEFSGPMGIGVASLLWKEGEWTLLLSQQKAFAAGKGYLVGGYAGIPLFDIHQIASLFWGNVVPNEASGKNALGIPFTVLRNADGRVSELRQGSERLEFLDYAEFDSGILPSEVRAYRNGKNVLNIWVKNVRVNVPWSDGTWRLSVPKKFDRL